MKSLGLIIILATRRPLLNIGLPQGLQIGRLEATCIYLAALFRSSIRTYLNRIQSFHIDNNQQITKTKIKLKINQLNNSKKPLNHNSFPRQKISQNFARDSEIEPVTVQISVV